MENGYQAPNTALKYLDFINSPNGKIQRDIIKKAVFKRMKFKNDAKILDAACGDAWLSEKLSQNFPKVWAVDNSPILIQTAKLRWPTGNIQKADISQLLPYEQEFFDCVILNMAVHDILDLATTISNLYKITKPGGTLLISLANPYYSFPIAVWKRGWFRFLFRLKPLLKLNPYYNFKPKTSFCWDGGGPSYFYPLSETINNILAPGFILSFFEELKSEQDSKNFDKSYQMFRFPTILFLEFKKPFK